MKFIEIFKNKYVIMFLILIVTNAGFYIYGHRNGLAATQNSAQTLTEKEKQLESLNVELGISKSQLISQSDLNKKLVSENDELKSKFNDFVKKNNLKLISVDDSIVSVKQQANGTKKVVVVKNVCPISDPNGMISDKQINPAISYEWHDEFYRFKLKDPNIFDPNDAVFTASQNFKIVGEIFKEKNGKLQTRRMVLQEVRELKDNTGRTKYVPIDGVQAKLVDSEFDYTEDKDLKIFRPRAIALFDTNKHFGFGVELLTFHNVGLNTHVSIPVDFSQIKTGSVRIGGAYNFVFGDVKTNIGLGGSVGTEFDKFFHNYNFSLDLLFYLND